MKRREFITLLGGAMAWPFAARAQQQDRMRRLGFLGPALASDMFAKDIVAAFAQGLGALGWKEGVNLSIDWRWYGADAALAERQAAEVIALKPDVILAGGNPAVEKVRQETKAIPVVFALVSDPVDGVTGRRRGVAGQAVVPHTDGVAESGANLLQASRRDDHGLLCRNRRVIGMLERLRCGCERQDRARGQGCERA